MAKVVLVKPLEGQLQPRFRHFREQGVRDQSPDAITGPGLPGCLDHSSQVWLFVIRFAWSTTKATFNHPNLRDKRLLNFLRRGRN